MKKRLFSLMGLTLTLILFISGIHASNLEPNGVVVDGQSHARNWDGFMFWEYKTGAPTNDTAAKAALEAKLDALDPSYDRSQALAKQAANRDRQERLVYVGYPNGFISLENLIQTGGTWENLYRGSGNTDPKDTTQSTTPANPSTSTTPSTPPLALTATAYNASDYPVSGNVVGGVNRYYTHDAGNGPQWTWYAGQSDNPSDSFHYVGLRGFAPAGTFASVSNNQAALQTNLVLEIGGQKVTIQPRGANVIPRDQSYQIVYDLEPYWDSLEQHFAAGGDKLALTITSGQNDGLDDLGILAGGPTVYYTIIHYNANSSVTGVYVEG